MGRGVWAGLAVTAAAAIVAVAFFLGGGDGDDDGGSAGTGSITTAQTTVSTATTLSPQAAIEAAVLDAYRRGWQAFITVARDPTAPGDDPRLAEHAAGNSLLVRQASIARLRAEGRAYRGEIELHPAVVSISGSTATVEDCNIDRTSVVDVRTGQVLVPPSTEGAAVTAVLRLEAGVWKEIEFTDLRRPCVPPRS